MTKFEALENIRKTWENSDLTLGEKIVSISTDYYANSLDLAGTAAFIKATPAELDALLSLSALDDDLIDLISSVNPPKTTWALLANANDEEIRESLSALHLDFNNPQKKSDYTFSEFVYQRMLETSGPSLEAKVASLSGNDLKHVQTKAESFDVLNDWQTKFLKGVAAQKRRGKTLTDKQITQLIPILNKLADNNVVSRNSIDNDQEICNRVLDALER